MTFVDISFKIDFTEYNIVFKMFIKFIILLLNPSREGLSKGHRCAVSPPTLQQWALPTAAAGKPETRTLGLRLRLL